VSFRYEVLTTRNLGFVTPEEQERLRDGRIFVCGTGGMGGAAIQSLVRAGVGHLALADIDCFEMSNLNRQVFCTLDTLGEPKAEATAAACRVINPSAEMEVLGAEWTRQAQRLIGSSKVVINGADDLAASLLLYRTAREFGVPVIDAYASPLPSVFVTRAGDPMPEERLGYPTIGTPWDRVTEVQRRQSFLREAEHVLLHSSSRRWIDLSVAGEVAAGQRSRMSWAPMVITTGQLMAYEALGLILGKHSATGPAGWFFNPYEARCEHPRNPVVAAALRPVVRRALRRMVNTA
jgi:hypothetical protein